MDDVNALVLSLYQSAREVPLDQFQEQALQVVNATPSFDVARWGTGSFDTQCLILHAPFLYNDSPESVHDYTPLTDHDRVAFYCASHSGETLNCYFPERSRHAPGLEAYAHRYRHEQGLITAFQNPLTGHTASISLYRAYERCAFTEGERWLMQTLFPPLLETLRVCQRLEAERIRQVDDRSRWSVAVADMGGVFANSYVVKLHREAGCRQLITFPLWPRARSGCFALVNAYNSCSSAVHNNTLRSTVCAIRIHASHQTTGCVMSRVRAWNGDDGRHKNRYVICAQIELMFETMAPTAWFEPHRDHYIRSYGKLRKEAARLTRSRDWDESKIVGFVERMFSRREGGWMARAEGRCYINRVTAARLADALNAFDHSDEALSNLVTIASSLVNNSMVGVSKFLYFCLPHLCAITDQYLRLVSGTPPPGSR
ncbi:hypothetical protein [Paraburkholderia unamae]|uniref:Uncharacterized protein n=1 Tax=Paraburkholderia unamae TaxID=219649 RepID=A0ACC6RWD3_9BURK